MAKVINIETLTLRQITTLYHQLPGVRTIKHFVTKAKGMERLAAGMRAASMVAVIGDQGVQLLAVQPAAAKAPAKARTSKAPAGDATHEDDAVISAVVSNPKRAGTAAADRYDLYRNGMTVAQFIAAVEKAGETSRKARSNLRWDEAHGFVQVGAAK